MEQESKSAKQTMSDIMNVRNVGEEHLRQKKHLKQQKTVGGLSLITPPKDTFLYNEITQPWND